MSDRLFSFCVLQYYITSYIIDLIRTQSWCLPIAIQLPHCHRTRRRPSNQEKTTYQCKCVHRINYCRYILGLLFTMGPPVVMCPDICWLKKVKVAHTRLPSVGFRSWSRFLAVNLQVTWVIIPAVGCHYFLPGLRLPSQPLRGLLPILLLGEQRHNGCEQFA